MRACVCVRETERRGTHNTRMAGRREGNSSAYTKVSDGGGAHSPLKSMVRQAVPCNLWRTTVKQRSTCSLQRIHCSRGIFAGGSPWRAHAGAGSGRSRRENPTFKQTFWRKLPTGDPHWSSPCRQLMLEPFVKDTILWEELHTEEAAGKCEEERAADTVLWTDHNPHHPLRRKEVEQSEMRE